MDVILDTNIFIADPWLRSQRTKGLLDYLAKTRDNLILLEAVELEVRGNVSRSILSAVTAVESALRNAERSGVTGVPSFDAATAVAESIKAWEAAFKKGLRWGVVQKVPLDPSILSEVVRRAAHRLPPVRANGRETRDTIIWLSLVQYLRDRKWKKPIVFISANTEDFATSDGSSLRSELLADLGDAAGSMDYFPSVEGFLREHAEPIKHITNEWVKDRLDLNAVAALIESRLERSVSPELYFRISDSDYRDYYEPTSVEAVTSVDVTLADTYVWEIEPEHIEVFLDFHATVEADLACNLNRSAPLGRVFDDGEYRWTRVLGGEAEVTVSIAAEIRGETLTLGAIEDISRL